MRILHISAGIYNGAGKAAAKIHCGLLDRGIASRLCVAIQSGPLPAETFSPVRSVARKVVERITRPLNRWMLEGPANEHEDGVSSGLIGFDIARIVASEQPDVVHLHWLGDTSFRIASLAAIEVPIVWRLPDMWAFCPVEYYQADAGRYAGPRPGLRTGVNRSAAIEALAWRAKATAYARLANLTIACPSRWLAKEARRSALLRRFPVEVVPTGCDTRLFTPRDQGQCRLALGLPRDRTILLAGALSLTLKRKGTAALIEALSMLGAEERNCTIATFGADSELGARLGGTIDVMELGPIGHRETLAQLYAAADAFIAPSLMENLANTVLEATSAGTPVVAFDIGGMPDVIEHKRNGYLAEPGSAASLADGLRWALGAGRHPAARHLARQKIVEQFSAEKEFDAYIALYRRLLADRDRGTSEARREMQAVGAEP